MLTKNYPLLLIIITVLFGCENLKSSIEGEKEDPFLIKTYYDNGTLKAEIPIDSLKKRHGLVKSFYSNGGLKTEVIYDHGTKKNAKQYFENGNIFMEINYKNGRKDSIRTKYWENGKVQSYLPYKNNYPGQGLREFGKSGKEYKKYPKLKVKQIDKLKTNGQYIIEVFFDKYPSKGTYYIGRLDDGFLTGELVEMKKVNGKGQIIYNPLPGTFNMERVYFVGKYKTTYGNPYLDEKSINLAIDF